MGTKEDTRQHIKRHNYYFSRAATSTKRRYLSGKEARQQRHLKMGRIFDVSRQEAIHKSEATLLVEPNVKFSSTKRIALSAFIATSLAIILILIILIASGEINIYTNQYMSTMPNKDNNFERNADFKDIFMLLYRGNFHTTEALSIPQMVLQIQSTAQSVVIIGSSGFGKPQTADEIMSSRNIFITDNLLLNEYEVAKNVNQLVRQSVEERTSKQQDCKDVDEYVAEQKEFLQNLPNTTVINYQSLERKHLADYIRTELRLEKMDLDKERFTEILDYTDAVESGCKTTRYKVFHYGRYEEKIKREQKIPNDYLITNCND